MGRQREGVYALGRALLEPGAAPVTALQGGPGSGRSHVLDAVGQLVARYGGQVLGGRALDGHRPSVAGALTSAVIGVSGQFESRRRHVLESVQDWPDGSVPADVVESVADLLCRQAGDRIGVLLLDDVHPDEPATDLVLRRFADAPQARAGRLRVLCGLSVPPASAAGWSWPTETVRSLSADEIGQLVLQRLGHRPTDHLVRWLLTASGGNPALATAAVDAWRVSGHLRLMDDLAVLGPRPGSLPLVADHPMLIGLDRLGPEPATLARACAVLGPLSLEAAAAVLGTDHRSARRAREVLQRSGVVGGHGWPAVARAADVGGPSSPVRGHCSIPIELARQLIAASVTPDQRREWQATVAVGDVGAGSDRPGPGSLSGHHESPPGSVGWCQVDGLDEALASALAAEPAAPPFRLTDGALADLTFDLLRAGRFTDLLTLAQRLTRVRPDQGEEGDLLQLATALTDPLGVVHGEIAGGPPVPAPTTVPSTAAGLAAACLNALASGDRSGGRRFAQQHDELVAAGGAARAWPVLGLADQCRIWLGDPLPGPDVDRPEDDSGRPLIVDLLDAFDSGHWDRALEAIHLLVCGHLRPQAWLPPISVPGMAALLWCRRGRLDRMRFWANQDPDALQVNLALAEASWLTGEPAAVVVRLRPWLDDRIARAGGAGLESLLCLLAEAAGACGESAVARQAADLLQDRAAHDHLAAGSAFGRRAAAVVAGDPGLALGSAADFASLGRPFDQARSLLAAARCGAEPATSALPAQRLMIRVGAPAWSRQAELLHRGGGELSRRAPGPPVDDIDLATLVAEGLSNRQAAAWAGLSVRTVEARLSALFTRTGCTSRTALAALHVEHGRRGLAQLLAA
jgi:DNA-binding CsgD family transcriptional regulator